MKKHLNILIVMLVSISMLFAACQPAAAPADEAQPDATAAESAAPAEDAQAPAAEQEPVTLRFLKINDELEAQAFNEMVEAFHQIDGGKWAYVNIEYDAKPFEELFPSIEKSVATDSPIDILQADGPDVKHFAYNGVLMDLTSYFTADELAIWDAQSVEEGSASGKFYAPPEAQSCQLLWYNADMLSEAGIDVSTTDGWTYGEDGSALANWQKLTKDSNGDGVPEVFGLANSGPWDYFQRIPSRTNGVPGDATYNGIADDGVTFTGYFDSDAAIESYQFQQAMVTDYKVMSAEPTANQMLSGLAATTIYQDMIMGTQADQFPEFNMGAIEPPYYQTPLCQTGSWHYGIASNTKHFDEALAFVKFASGDEGAQFIWKYKSQIPANVNLLNTLTDFQDVPARKLMADFMLENGVNRIQTPAYTEYNSLFTEFFNSLVSGEAAADLAHEYAGLMDEAAAKYAGWNE
jgi:fructooligosaccharide transport system substrate-binding protein